MYNNIIINMEERQDSQEVVKTTYEKYSYLINALSSLSVFVFGFQFVTTVAAGYAALKYDVKQLKTLFLFMTTWLLFGFWYSVFSMCLTVLHVLVYQKEMAEQLAKYYNTYVVETETYIKGYEKLNKLDFTNNPYYGKLVSVYEQHKGKFNIVSSYLEKTNNSIKVLVEYMHTALENLTSSLREENEYPEIIRVEEKKEARDKNEEIIDLEEYLGPEKVDQLKKKAEDIKTFNFDPKDSLKFDPKEAAGFFKNLPDLDFSKLPESPPVLPDNIPFSNVSRGQMLKEINDFKHIMSELDNIQKNGRII